MGCPHEMRPDMSVTDIAFCILKNRGKSTHFKELISEVMRVKAINQDNPGRLIAQMHTEISLDSRFIHQGNGEWGLREWSMPKGNKVVKIRPESPSAPKTSRNRLLRDDEEAEEDAFESEEEEELEREEESDDYESESDEYEEDEDDEV